MSRELKNSSFDQKALDRELIRMQKIDRLKVQHARDAFYNADTGRFLPSLDTMHAASSTRAPVASSGVIVGQSNEDLSFLYENPSMISENDVVTRKELSDIQQRFGRGSIDKQKIIISRTGEEGTPTQSLSKII